MRAIFLVVAGCLMALTSACSDGVHPEYALATEEKIVSVSPAALYEELDQTFTDVEAASKQAKPVAHDTREPVEFTFEREPGRRLRLQAKARWRVIVVHAFIEPGTSPDEAKLRVYFNPKWVRERAGSEDLQVALTTLLSRVQGDLESSGAVETLFYFRPSPVGKSGFAECSPTDCGE